MDCIRNSREAYTVIRCEVALPEHSSTAHSSNSVSEKCIFKFEQHLASEIQRVRGLFTIGY